MRTTTGNSNILWFQLIGYAVIIVITWLADIVSMADGEPLNYSELLFESAVVVVVAIPVMLASHRLLSRLQHLEGFLRVCAWCRKLESHGEWIPTEEFFREEFHLESSHGICPECYARSRPPAAFPDAGRAPVGD